MNSKIEAKYRSLFLTELGQEVLTDILVEFCYQGQYHEAGSAEQDGAYNVGLKIMSRMGLLVDDKTLVRGMLSAIPGVRVVMPMGGEDDAIPE